MPRRKQIYKITYPNGKIYVGMDLIGTLINVGSPSARERIAADLDAHRLDLTLAKRFSGSPRRRQTVRFGRWKSS